MQMVVDFNNDGTADGILVGESIYGNDWWLSNSAAPFVKANTPSHTGGFGSDNHGTLNQWLTNFPHAQVKAVGFSLGSGVQGDYTIRSLTFGCVKYTFGRVVITPVVCEAPRNGGIITKNTADWTTSANAEFVNGAVKMTSSDWNDSLVTYTHSYPVSQAPTLAWTVTGESAVTGAHGIGIILKTSTGAYIHYEPSPYTDAFWTNTPGLLPANAGGQGGPYSGSLQDLLDTAGSDVTIVETSVIFTSQDQNEILLTGLSFNCTRYTFNKASAPQDNGNVLGETTTKTGGQGQGQVLGTSTALPTTLPSTGADAMLNALVTVVAMGVAYVLSYRFILRKLV
jgi:hypothetical protein